MSTYFDSTESVMEAVLNPDWNEFNRTRKHVHDWRTYVIEPIREKWDHLSLETRYCVVVTCQSVADAEHWD